MVLLWQSSAFLLRLGFFPQHAGFGYLACAISSIAANPMNYYGHGSDIFGIFREKLRSALIISTDNGRICRFISIFRNNEIRIAYRVMRHIDGYIIYDFFEFVKCKFVKAAACKNVDFPVSASIYIIRNDIFGCICCDLFACRIIYKSDDRVAGFLIGQKRNYCNGVSRNEFGIHRIICGNIPIIKFFERLIENRQSALITVCVGDNRNIASFIRRKVYYLASDIF